MPVKAIAQPAPFGPRQIFTHGQGIDVANPTAIKIARRRVVDGVSVSPEIIRRQREHTDYPSDPVVRDTVAEKRAMAAIQDASLARAEPSTEGALMPTIALVDDDRNRLTSVSIAVEAEGYRVMTYSDGCSALQGFKTSPPDLVILDIKMPRMDGMELLRRLREKSDKPVIFLTSKEEEIDELCC